MAANKVLEARFLLSATHSPITYAQLGALIGRHEQTVYRWQRENAVPPWFEMAIAKLALKHSIKGKKGRWQGPRYLDLRGHVVEEGVVKALVSPSKYYGYHGRKDEQPHFMLRHKGVRPMDEVFGDFLLNASTWQLTFVYDLADMTAEQKLLMAELDGYLEENRLAGVKLDELALAA